MELTKNYLTSTEIRYILNELSNIKEVYSREIVKNGLIAQFVLDEELTKEFETCNDVYDFVISNGVKLEDEVINYDIIDKIYKEEHSVENQLEGFIDTMSAKLEKSMKKLPKDLKNFKLDEFLKQIKEVVDKDGEKL